VEVTHLFAGLAVRDLTASCRWYEVLVGRPPDVRPAPDEALWHFGAASVYLRADPGRAGGGLLALAVPDLDAYLSALATRGLTAERRHATPPRVVLLDDDGNEVTLFEDPGAAAPAPDVHLLVKQRDLESEAVQTLRELEEAVAGLSAGNAATAALVADVRAQLQAALPPGAARPEWGALAELVRALRVAQRLLRAQLDSAQGEALAERIETLDVLRRRRQNLGRGGAWVET
jgi:catechol 2,3-dioxygenase-like lactoylglutathione lyase family enzyme